ncbi:hypothetical protein [Synechococcus elongatus]|uniref:hypothetical protein n=1 Tax=Synechococcus elongatus TaxID=32046 RepID=UPI0030D23393
MGFSQVLLERLPRNWQGDFTYEGATQAQNYPTGLQVTGYSISGRVLSFAGLLNWGGDRQSEVFGYIDSQTGQIEFYERQNVGPTAESGAGGSFIGFLALPDEQRIPAKHCSTGCPTASFSRRAFSRLNQRQAQALIVNPLLSH